jgi:hypothetical protein
VKEADVLKWFEDLLQRGRDVPEGYPSTVILTVWTLSR